MDAPLTRYVDVVRSSFTLGSVEHLEGAGHILSRREAGIETSDTIVRHLKGDLYLHPVVMDLYLNVTTTSFGKETILTAK